MQGIGCRLKLKPDGLKSPVYRLQYYTGQNRETRWTNEQQLSLSTADINSTVHNVSIILYTSVYAVCVLYEMRICIDLQIEKIRVLILSNGTCLEITLEMFRILYPVRTSVRIEVSLRKYYSICNIEYGQMSFGRYFDLSEQFNISGTS